MACTTTKAYRKWGGGYALLLWYFHEQICKCVFFTVRVKEYGCGERKVKGKIRERIRVREKKGK
jgi:hypothetical protein